ncbi:MAG: PE-PPE domain-containing protein [Mycobacterium sp.]
MAGTVVLAGTQTMMPLAVLTATALIMGGTGHPLSTPQDSPEFINSYVNDANNDYIVLTGFCGSESCTPTAVSTPEQFMPVSGTMPFDLSVAQGVTNLDHAINAQPAGTEMVVFGYSQSARIASIQKANLAAAGSTLPVSFVLIGNPNRPNGGILQRFEGLEIPILGVTFDGATPTDTNFQTVDITRQYDGWSDFPNNPVNPFATANAAAGIHYLHGDYQSVGLGNALYQGSYGDTQYYMIPSNRLPLLMPLAELGVPDPVLTILDAPARVLVETGYNRTISPGQPTPAMLMYFPNPVETGVNFIIAIPTGLDDGAQQTANIRPFGTPPIDQRSPYGVGGPPVNAGTFDATGAPVGPAPPPATPVASAQPLTGKPPAPALPMGPQPTARPGPLQPAAAPVASTPVLPEAAPSMDKAAPPKTPTEMTLPWAKPAALPKPAPAELPKPAPAELPKPVPAELPKLTPPKVEIPTQAPIPAELPKPVAPVEIPAPAFDPPEIPAALPLPPPVQAPSLPAPPPIEAPSLPALPAPPPMPLPPPPPMPALPNFGNLLGGLRLPF